MDQKTDSRPRPRTFIYEFEDEHRFKTEDVVEHILKLSRFMIQEQFSVVTEVCLDDPRYRMTSGPWVLFVLSDRELTESELELTVGEWRDNYGF